ncbi:putative ubiquitin-protein ligase [Hibiscus syriacus]|uniref:Protein DETOXIFICATION n=1 Tax=Hibiscus syriacus TaxID=106335 RepID=A0A6A3AJ91_HIBSY|nr:putative ubiquitin-protein ligase [Hibiscus syriacus]
MLQSVSRSMQTPAVKLLKNATTGLGSKCGVAKIGENLRGFTSGVVVRSLPFFGSMAAGCKLSLESAAMAADIVPLLNDCDDNDSKQRGTFVYLVKEFGYESKRLWHIAGPAIFTAICQYSLGALTQTFTGQLTELDLPAVSVENSVIAGLGFGVTLGMGSALETLCGQAYGAGRLRMLGVYMQRSWIILVITSCLISPIYIWSPPILKLFEETTEISDAAGKFALWMMPQLFAYAMNFPIQKFLQAQSKVLVMAWVSALVLVLHAFFSWLLILKLDWGLIGAAVTLNVSWWLIVIGQLLYIFITKSDGAWSGFSRLAFADLFGFVKLSLASAIILEFWYLMVLIVITGLLPNPLIAVDAISICMNINGWDAMIALGFNAAISVRVSNELGAGNARLAKFSVLVVSMTSVIIGIVCMIVVYATRGYFPYLFTSSNAVAKETTKLALLLGFTVLLNSLQPVLSGVAVGAGWQSLVAYINIGCYYIFGLPVGILLGRGHLVRHDCGVYRGYEIMTDMNARFKISISYSQAWRAKCYALELLRGSPEASFAQLPTYCHNLKLKNHGSVTHIKTDRDGRFELLSIAIGAAWYYKKRNHAGTLERRVTPWNEKKITKRVVKSMSWRVEPCSNTLFEVLDNNLNGLVDLNAKTCSCKKWQTSGYPCGHVIKVALNLNQYDSSAYAMDCYTTEVYRQTYAEIVYPCPHPSEWDIPDDLQIILPTIMDSRLPGRPKKHDRIPSKGEEKRISTCSRCKENGHTRLTCGSPVPSQSSSPLPKNGSSSKSKAHMVPSKRKSRSQSKSKSQSQPALPFGTY